MQTPEPTVAGWGRPKLAASQRGPTRKRNLERRACCLAVACLLLMPACAEDPSRFADVASALRDQGASQEAKARAVGILEKAAQEGDPVALYNFGVCLRDGVVRPTDVAGGLDRIKRAADRGYLPAIVTYAESLRLGKGLQTDQKAAAQYLLNGLMRAPEWVMFHLARVEWEWATRLQSKSIKVAGDLMAQGRRHMERAMALRDARAKEYLRRKPQDTRGDDYTEYAPGDVDDGRGNGMQMPWGLGFCFPEQIPAQREQKAEELEQLREEISRSETTIAGLQSVAPAPLGGEGATSTPSSPQVTPTPTWRPVKTNAPAAPATTQAPRQQTDPDADLKNFRSRVRWQKKKP